MAKRGKPSVRATKVGDMLEIQLCPVHGGTVRPSKAFLLPLNDRAAIRAKIVTEVDAARAALPVREK